jgi:hypothetical protein
MKSVKPISGEQLGAMRRELQRRQGVALMVLAALVILLRVLLISGGVLFPPGWWRW